MVLDISARCDVARIRAVSEDGHRIYLQYPSGQTATVDRTDEPFDWLPGSVVLVRAHDTLTSSWHPARSGPMSRGWVSSV